MDKNLSVTQILNDLGDKTKCYVKMYDESYHYTNKRNSIFMCTIVAMSLLTVLSLLSCAGKADVAISGYLYAIVIFLAMKVLIEITFFYFRITETSIKFKMGGINWQKLNGDIHALILDIKMGKTNDLVVNDRQNRCIIDYNRLVEITPKLNKYVIRNFNEFIKKNGELKNMHKPDICGNFRTTEALTNTIVDPRNSENGVTTV